MATTTQDRDLQKPGRVQPTPKGRIGLIVAASLAIGLLAALALSPPRSSRRKRMS